MNKRGAIPRASGQTELTKLWGARALLVLLSLMLGLSAVAFWPIGQAQAAGTTIDAAKLKSISRLYFSMRDENKQLYTLYLFANDEKRTVTTEDRIWAGASEGDVVYSGKYQAALVKNGQKTGVVQAVELNYTTLNANRNESFRLPGDGKARPDIVFLSETASSSFNSIYGFVIKGGTLRALDFASETGVKWGKEGYASPNQGVRGLSDNRIQTRTYTNVIGQYYFSTYRLDLKALKLKHVDDAYAASRSWPSTQGAHAWLDSIKKSALRHELPANPKVKIGMTEKQVRAIMGKPTTVENGEWSGYLSYRNSWIGFNEYAIYEKLPAGARVSELTQGLGDVFLTPDQVEEWLGKPTEKYEDEAEGGYVLLYRWNKAQLMFGYEDEYSPISSFSIY